MVDADSRQVAGVLSPTRDLLHQPGVAPPERHVVAGARRVNGEGGAPAPRAEHGDASVHRRSPIRRSAPTAMRRMLARWRNRIRMATPAAAMTTDTGAPKAHATEGSATVAATE